MLCGEFSSRASPLGLHLSLADTRSPYFTLLAFCQGMAAFTAAPDDDDIFLENGLLSYRNPNYHLDPARLDDALNSNTEQLYEELFSELDAVCNLSGGRAGGGGGGGKQPQGQGPPQGQPPSTTTTATTAAPAAGPGRRAYAALDIGSMGVDVSTGPVTALGDAADDNLNNARDEENTALAGALDNNSFNDNANTVMGRRSLDLTASLRAKPDLIEAAERRDSTGEKPEIPHVAGSLNNDLYAVPVKRRPHSLENDLPPGWEKHEDNDGPYYWHIKSGTIQREPPSATSVIKAEAKRPLVQESESSISSYQSPVIASVTRSNTSSALEELDGKKKEERKEELALKRRSYPARPEPESKERPIRFAVRSLGWVEIAEEDLTPERSSKAVNKCIVDLSLGRNDLLDVVGRWGDGKDLFMDLDEGALKLIDPENLTVLNTQPIHTIRVWGVGRDNGRDFAYVARDRTTRKHMCHVFRCDIPARTIANTLRDICKKIMIERSLQQNLAKPIDISGTGGGGRSGLAARPTNLPTEHRRFHHRSGQALVTQSFPTPMEEPKKVLRAQYLGSTQVTKATGMDILNDAIDQMVATVPHDKWCTVNVAVAPSMISIMLPGEESKLIAECRVRYLSFLGIGRNVKQCGFIMHTAQDLFMAHVFHCEPSSGALCKTVEAACKLRYQKCLDAHPQGLGRGQQNAQTPGKGLGATLKSLVGSLTGRRLRGSES